MTTATPQPNRPGGIHFYDRVFVAGQTGSGKSVWINHIAAQFRCQVLLYDTKDEFTVPGIAPVYAPAKIDWNQRVIHLIDDAGDVADANRLFKIAWQRKVGRSGHAYGLVVVVHEVGDLCADNPGKTPQWVSNFNRKGRAHSLGLLAGAQRPYNIPKTVRTECQVVISFARGCDPEDMPVMAALHRMTLREYEQALAQARQLGEHAYIYGDRVNRVNVIRPPLPPQLLRTTLAQGIDPSKHQSPEDSEAPAPESSGEPPELSGEYDHAHHRE